MKPRARYTPRLKSWAFWMPYDGWSSRHVGFGETLDEAYEDWQRQNIARAMRVSTDVVRRFHVV